MTKKEKIKVVIWLNKVQKYPNFGNMTLENLNPAGDFSCIALQYLSAPCSVKITLCDAGNMAT